MSSSTLQQDPTYKKFLLVRIEGDRRAERNIDHFLTGGSEHKRMSTGVPVNIGN
jgi:hypothetical protein